MSAPEPVEQQADDVALARRVLDVLDRGAANATYKFALLLALIGHCEQSAGEDATVPDRVPLVALGERVLRLYWPQAREYPVPTTTGVPGRRLVLFQSQNPGGGDERSHVTVVSDIVEVCNGPPPVTAEAFRRSHPDDWQRLVRSTTKKLLYDPIPRLQRIDRHAEPFLYHQDWPPQPTLDDFADRQWPTELRLRPGVGQRLARLGPLLRPVIQDRWRTEVQRINRADLAEHTLEQFLFGAERMPLARALGPLGELQQGRCFYCDGDLGRLRQLKEDDGAQVDHFVPWSRQPDDGVHNLVAACGPCNRSKSSALAGERFVRRWADRLTDPSLASELQRIADAQALACDAARSLGAARSQYLWLPDGSHLWVGRHGGRPVLEPSPPVEQLAALLADPPPANAGLAAEASDDYDPPDGR